MRFFKLALQKAYFDKGYGVTSYFKYLVVLIGMERVISGDLKSTIIIMTAYGIFCYLFGWAMYKYGYVEAEKEVENKFNLLAKQLRNKLKIEKFK